MSIKPPQASLFNPDDEPAPPARAAAKPRPVAVVPNPEAKAESSRPEPLRHVSDSDYGATSIEVLEGLEPVRKRPGMYIGGTDEKALHHLFAELLDNAMDEAVAGHAKAIWVELDGDGYLSVRDDGRGIPVDPHPKYPGKSALEVIMTVLHSGGKFSGKAYETSGGLHGVGVSVVNALSERLEVTVWKDGFEWQQNFSRGHPQGQIEQIAPSKKHGSKLRFIPDPEIFGAHIQLKPARLYRMAKAKAYLFRGVQIFWKCAANLISDSTPAEDKFYFPNGLADYLAERVKGTETLSEIFSGRVERKGEAGAVEWAVVWSAAGFGEADGFVQSYCNTIPTPDGGTHEAGLRAALTRSLKSYAEMTGDKRGAIITAEDVAAYAGIVISVFIKNPEFQGQTKDRLSSNDALRLVDNALRDPFDHWLTAAPKQAEKVLQFIIERAEERLKRRKDKEVQRASATRKLRLPGKLADCSKQDGLGTELFI
ncbi:MAG: ATP-binding protein, partial [Asticcacaulis sp.]